MKAVAVHTSGLHFDATTDNDLSIRFDTSSEKGGDGLSASPVQHLLAALCACTGMDVASVLEKKRHVVTGFRVEGEGVRREEHPRIFTSIALVYRFANREIPLADIERAIELSLDKYCTLSGTLRASGCEIRHSVEFD